MNEFISLTEKNIDDAIEFQEIVMADLNDAGNYRFIIERSRDYFLKHLDSPNKVLGLYHDDKLVAQSVFHHSQAINPDYIKGISIDDYKICDPVSILQGAIIHPKFRGKGLFSSIIKNWINHAGNHGYNHIMARVEEHNTTSISAFKKFGFDVIGIVKDARDNADVAVLYKRIS
jgi:RimJ/RimL family protein N-acetyltransferase